ncbi:expressed unknown protein [Seminavis robusta]|uniref:Uncharacterized protein n=1 Tax=Seminavis robusta TaxID=568900 RepID=A0A9N8ERD3_9STRA|nr:expressed unknown protein [Seminavis robusta]|eukprot:Sro1449_g273660.1 n/a (318) ;mRNA; r:12324-13277
MSGASSSNANGVRRKTAGTKEQDLINTMFLEEEEQEGQETSTINVTAESSNNDKADDNDVSISVIAVLSAQRSSSSFLARDILAQMDECHVNLNEVLAPSAMQSGDAWAIEANHLGFAHLPITQVDPDLLAQFVLQVGRRKCRETLLLFHSNNTTTTTHNNCHNHCWIVYKHFDTHLALWQHSLFLKSMIQQLQRDVESSLPITRVHDTRFVMAILERHAEERWRSKWYARHHKDWDTHGTPQHRQQVDLAQDVPPMAEEFAFAHDQWYQLIRGFAAAAAHDRVRVLELTYENITQAPIPVTQALVRQAAGGAVMIN